MTANGPLSVEDRIYPFDLSGAQGDSIRIRIRPPFGFWSIDRFALAMNVVQAVETARLAPVSAVDQTGRDVLGHLIAADGLPQFMPKMRDAFVVAFNVPPSPTSGQSRAWFLETTGHYELHLDKTRAACWDLIDTFQATPEAVLDYSRQLYRSWIGDLAAGRR